MFDIFTIINWLKKTINKKDSAILFLIVLCFLLTRLVNLDKFPIFGDEGIYIRWAKVARLDASWRFISLTDGKQPLQTWGTIPFLKLIPSNPLLSGRLFAVATGLFGLLGIMFLCFYLFGKRAALIGTLLYTFTPFFLFYDRMALVDSGVNAFSIWMILFSIILARTVRFDISLLYGFLAGLALLAKSSVRLFLGLGYLALILITPNSKNTKGAVEFLKKFVNFSFLYLLSSTIAIIIYNIQRLSPFFHYVALKNKTFVMTLDEFIKSPLANFSNNIKIIPYYVFSEMGYVIGFTGLIGLYYLSKKNRRLAIYLGFWIVIPFFIIALVSKVIFPRYLIFFASLLTILTTYFLIQIKDKTRLAVITIIIVISIVYFDYAIILDHKNIPFPDVDRGQYIEGITAGWGIDELVQYARVKSKEKHVVLMAEGDFGVIGDQINAYLLQNENIDLKGYWPLKEEHVLENQKLLNNNYVYVVFSHQIDLPQGWPIRLIKKYNKPGGKAAIYFAEVVR